MKKIIGIFMILLAFSLFITGCSSEKAGINDKQGMFREGQNIPERGMFREGFNDEQRQQMMAEMQQRSIDACTGKNEGDSCTMEAPQGRGPVEGMQGTCKIENENLLCKFERPNMPNREGQPMFEEMRQRSIDACIGKVERDSCTIEGGRGEMQGTCAVENENLLCRFERPEMPFR